MTVPEFSSWELQAAANDLGVALEERQELFKQIHHTLERFTNPELMAINAQLIMQAEHQEQLRKERQERDGQL